MSFLLKSALVIALVYFAVHRREVLTSLERARGASEMASGGDRRAAGAGARDDAPAALQRAAAARLADAAREHCLARPHDCLTLLKAVGAESVKHGGGDR